MACQLVKEKLRLLEASMLGKKLSQAKFLFLYTAVIFLLNFFLFIFSQILLKKMLLNISLKFKYHLCQEQNIVHFLFNFDIETNKNSIISRKLRSFPLFPKITNKIFTLSPFPQFK